MDWSILKNNFSRDLQFWCLAVLGAGGLWSGPQCPDFIWDRADFLRVVSYDAMFLF